MSMGQRIAQKRKERNLSQEALGEALGVSRQAIYKWESDASLPEIDKLVALSRLFNVPVGWLLGVEEENTQGGDSLSEKQLHMVEEIFRRVLEDGEPRITPHAQHMYTYLTAVVLYDSADAQALAQLQKLKKRREYKLSLHGWMEFRIAAVDVSTGEIAVNRSGKTIRKDLRRLTERLISHHNKGEEKTQ